MDKWDFRFLKLAKEISTWSKDTSTKVGAIFVSEDRQYNVFGYNGFAHGIDDSEDRYKNRDLKIELTLHAEENIVIFGDKSKMKNGTIYTWPLMPCSRCAAKIIQCGIKRVVSVHSDNGRWNFDLTLLQFKEVNIELTLYNPEEIK